MKINITPEIIFQTARSGGKGGQNVNKVETMVEGRWHVATSALASNHQKEKIQSKLANRITAEGFLLVKSQQERSQLGNKQLVIRKMNELVNTSLQKKKIRIATKPSKAAIERKSETKRKISQVKDNRKKLNPRQYL